MNKNILKLFAILMLCFALVSVLVACGADGKDGADGKSPYMGEDGKLYVWDADKNDFVGYEIKGEDGKDGEDGEDGKDLTCGDTTHVWAEEGIVYAEHTVDSEGIVLYPCENCGVLSAEIVGHNYVAGTPVAPTCTSEGYTVYTCECGDSYEDDVTEILPHAFGEWEDTLYHETYEGCECECPTVYARECPDCGERETKEDPAPGHVYTTWEPTVDDSNTTSPCLQVPLQVSTCDVCGHDACNKTQAVPGATAKGHTWGDWYIVTAPTADAEGTIARKCTECADKHDVGTETATIPALNTTDYTYTETPATCVDAGEGVYTIVKDETTLTVKVTLEALGHNYTNGVYEIVTVPGYATSEEDALTKVGSAKFTCDVCGETVEKELPALGGAGTGRFIVSMGDCLDPVDGYNMPVDVDGYQVFVEFEAKNPNYSHDEKPADDADYTILVGDSKWYKAYWCTKCNHWIIVESYDEDPNA